MARDRFTELRRAQKNLLALHGFNWARVGSHDGDKGAWYIFKGKTLDTRDPLAYEIVDCIANLQHTMEMMHQYNVNNDLEKDDAV